MTTDLNVQRLMAAVLLSLVGGFACKQKTHNDDSKSLATSAANTTSAVNNASICDVASQFTGFHCSPRNPNLSSPQVDVFQITDMGEQGGLQWHGTGDMSSGLFEIGNSNVRHPLMGKYQLTEGPHGTLNLKCTANCSDNPPYLFDEARRSGPERLERIAGTRISRKYMGGKLVECQQLNVRAGRWVKAECP